MRRFFVRLYVATALLHLPFALAVAHLAGGSALAWAFTALGALALTAAFHGRVSLQRWDRPVDRWRRLFEEAYFVHWMALVLALPLWPIALLSWAFLPGELWSWDGLGRVALSS